MENNAINREERRYVAISIDHQRGKDPVFWGWHRTADDEQRCFGGYTQTLENAELYSLREFAEKYGNSVCKTEEPVPMKLDFWKRYKKYDTVMVDIDEIKTYMNLL